MVEAFQGLTVSTEQTQDIRGLQDITLRGALDGLLAWYPDTWEAGSLPLWTSLAAYMELYLSVVRVQRR